ncbi:hypothetical protein MMC27_005627 [Xylographa pallens]|nr:hypothetical protein [Xylographa pallens]
MERTLDLDGSNFTPVIHSDTYSFINSSKCELSGKHVFITGASKGIGRATALAFTKAGAAAVGIGARSDLESLEHEIADMANRSGKPVPQIVKVQLDVTERANVEAAASKVKIAFGGRLDILVNNAGVLEEPTKIIDSDPDIWWNSYTVNIRGVYLVTRAFLPMMLAGAGGKADKQILNVASVGAMWCYPGLSSYQTGKLALLRLAEFINAEYGDQGILAYSMHPGNVGTNITDHFKTPIRGFSFNDKPELSADTIVYLTKERREWLAGRYVSANWDMPQFLDRKDEIIRGDLLKINGEFHNVLDSIFREMLQHQERLAATNWLEADI